jgi:putative ABC transport system permease protein
LYVLYPQGPAALTAAMRRITIRVRTQSAPLSLATAVRNAVSAIDKDQPVFPPTTLDQADSRSLAPERLLTILFGTFALAAIALASLGIYGVMAYSVTRRTHEIAIRLALGAHISDVIWLVLGQGLKLIAVGVAMGLVAAFNLSQVLSGYIFGVSPTDLSAYVSVSLLLAATALVACYLPARRATKVDPMTALRCE